MNAVIPMGVEIEVLWPNLVALALLGLAADIAAVWRFQATLG